MKKTYELGFDEYGADRRVVYQTGLRLKGTGTALKRRLELIVVGLIRAEFS